MIVTCPSCQARYKIDEAKLKGRGAKITCPKCAHKFVVYREEQAPDSAEPDSDPDIPSDLPRRDFKRLGIAWKVRRQIGIMYDVKDLATLREFLAEGQITDADSLAYDGKTWTVIKEIPNLEAHFYDVWKRAEAGEIAPTSVVAHEEGEDESDAPTTLITQGTSLADEIRKVVQDAKTPGVQTGRSTAAPAEPAAPAPAPPKPDPFENLGQKAQAEQKSPVGMYAAIAIVAAIVVIVPLLWALGVLGGGNDAASSIPATPGHADPEQPAPAAADGEH